MVSDMGRVLVRKAEGDRKPKGDPEKENFVTLPNGMKAYRNPRTGELMPLTTGESAAERSRKEAEEQAERRAEMERTRITPGSEKRSGAAQRMAREARELFERRREELGPARPAARREAFEETDEDEREKRDIGASFRAGLDARRTIMQGQEDAKTGGRREKGFISENIQGGDEGAGLGNIGQVFDPSGVHPYFRSKQGPRDEIPVPKLLNRFLSSEPERFQAMFGADPSTVMSLGRSGGGSDEMRQMLIAQALGTIRDDPAKFQEFLTTQGLELSVDDDSMGALGSTRADLGDMDSVGDLARTMRLSQPGAVMFQQLDRMLQEQGLRMTPEAQRDLVAAANPGSFGEVQGMMDNVMQDAMQQATPITTTTAGIAPELVGRGKEISIDAPEVRPAPQERDPMVTAQQRMDLQIQREFENLVRQGQASPEMLDKFKSAVMQSLSNQAVQVSDMRRQMAEAEIARNPLARTRVDIQQALAGEMDEAMMNQMAGEAMSNALQQVNLRGEGGEFLSEMDQIYGDRAFEQMDASRRAMEQGAMMETGPLEAEVSRLKLQLRQLDMLPEREKPADYREQMARIQSAIDAKEDEIGANFVQMGGRPTEERQRPSMDELSPEAKRTEYAFRTGQNIPTAGSDVQNTRRGQPVQIPGMGGEQSDSRLDRTVPESQDEIRGRRRRAKGMRESGQSIRGEPDFSQLSQEQLEEMLMGGGDAPAPAATADTAAPPSNMNFLQRLQAGVGALDDDDEVQTGQWMSVGEQLLKGIQDDMTRRILKGPTPIPDELRANQYDSPAEKERKRAAILQLQNEAYENNPRTIQRREQRKREGMAEMDRDAEKFAAQYEQATGRPLYPEDDIPPEDA